MRRGDRWLFLFEQRETGSTAFHNAFTIIIYEINARTYILWFNLIKVVATSQRLSPKASIKKNRVGVQGPAPEVGSSWGAFYNQRWGWKSNLARNDEEKSTTKSKVRSFLFSLLFIFAHLVFLSQNKCINSSSGLRIFTILVNRWLFFLVLLKKLHFLEILIN